MATSLARQDLRKLAKARLRDSEVLYGDRRYDGAVYLCGYVVELALKARICRTLRWLDYRTGQGYQSFKTHDLEILLTLSGAEHRVKPAHLADWSIVLTWDPELRYRPVGSASQNDAHEIMEAARRLLKIL